MTDLSPHWKSETGITRRVAEGMIDGIHKRDVLALFGRIDSLEAALRWISEQDPDDGWLGARARSALGTNDG